MVFKKYKFQKHNFPLFPRFRRTLHPSTVSNPRDLVEKKTKELGISSSLERTKWEFLESLARVGSKNLWPYAAQASHMAWS